MKNAICTVAAAPVRKEPSHRSEMTSQLLFGETAEVLEEKDEWRLLRATYDGYEGWVTEHLIDSLPDGFSLNGERFVATGLLNSVTLPDGLINAPMGATLTGFDPETRLLWDGQHKYHGTWRSAAPPFEHDLFLRTVQAWLNAPYLWGGRTFMGVDCSGFVQVTFKVQGISLLRDAYQQAAQGEAVESLSEAAAGDLAFFHNESGRITHVGILLNSHQIVHASGKVRIDRISPEGIQNVQTGKRTHRLHSIRRII